MISHSTIRCWFVAALLVLATAACSHPDEQDAREWHGKHNATLKKIDEATRNGIKDMPELTKAFACSPSPEPAASASASAAGSVSPPSLAMPIRKLVEANRCSREKGKWLEKRSQRVRDFRTKVLPPLLKLPGVIGVQVKYRLPEHKNWMALANLGMTPGGIMRGHVPWQSGTTMDGHKLGWGEYQTAYENKNGKFGDGKGRPGIEVSWELTQDDARFLVEAWVLAEDTVDDKWRAGLR